MSYTSMQIFSNKNHLDICLFRSLKYGYYYIYIYIFPIYPMMTIQQSLVVSRITAGAL